MISSRLSHTSPRKATTLLSQAGASQAKLTGSCGINLRSAKRRRDRSDESEQARDESTSRHKRQKTGHC